MKNIQIVKAAFLTGALLCAMTGCVGQTNTPIVSEKMETPQKSQEEEKKHGDYAKDIREQAKVPEIYTVEIHSEDMTILGKVKVETPEKEQIPVVEVQYLPYTEEELETMKEILKDEVGITEWLIQSQDSPQTFTSPDQTYILSLAKGSEKERPMVWLSSPGISDGSSKEDGAEDLSGFSMSEDDRNIFQHEMEGRAERLMEKMGMEDFYLEEVRWRQLSVSRNYSWSRSGQYGLRLYYQRKVEDMNLVDNERGYPAQYVEFLYKEDGTLLTIKNIGREELKITPEYVGFLLPFSSVSQVFEQCMKTLPTDPDALTEAYPGAVPHRYLTITDVKLVYGLEYKEGDFKASDAGGGRGKLVPVWAFYGRAERGYQDPNGVELKIPRTSLSGSEHELLLMVHAEDGRVYGR